MTLNTEYIPSPIDLDDSINEYNTNLTNESPEINQPLINENYKMGEDIKLKPKEPIYIMTIELGDGNSEAIKIYPDSIPEELSFNFCKTHNLDFQSMSYLNSQLISLMEQFRKAAETDKMNSIQEVDEEEYVSDRIRTSKINKTNNLSQVNLDMIRKSSQEVEKGDNKEDLSSPTDDFFDLNANKSNNHFTNLEKEEKIQSNSFLKLDPINKMDKNKNPNSEINTGLKTDNNLIKSNLYKHLKSKKEVKIPESQSRNLNSNTNKRNIIKENTKNANLFSYEIYEIESKTKKDKTENNSTTPDINKIKPSHSQSKSKVTFEKFQKNSKDNLKTKSNTLVDKKSNKSSESIFERLYKNYSYRKLGFFNIGSLSHNSSKQNENLDNNTRNSILNSNNLRHSDKNYFSDNKQQIESDCSINIDQMFQPISPINKSLMKAQKKNLNPESINYGERLYQRNIKQQEETRRKIEFLKKIREEEYHNQFKFKPRINSKSADIIRRRYEDKIIKMLNLNNNGENNNQNNFSDQLNINDIYNISPGWLDNISNYNIYIEDKLEKLRKKYEKVEEYPFAPQINKNSKHIAEEKLRSKLFLQLPKKAAENSKLESIILKNARIEELYDQWRLKQLKINKLADNIYSEYTFKPNLNNQRYNSEILNLRFDQRQEIFKKKVEEKLSKLDKMSYNYKTEKVRSNTSSKSPNNNRHTSNIFFNLYSLAEKYSRDKQNRVKLAEEEIIKNMGSVYTLGPSDNMIQKMKEQSFKKIFKILDQDEDDIISSFYIDTHKLDKEILRILQPILIELKEEQETLNEDEFVRACMHLYEILDYVDKRTLLDFGKKFEGRISNESSGYNFTFKPTIDKRSRKMAESKFLTIDLNRNGNEREEMSYSNLINTLNKTSGR